MNVETHLRSRCKDFAVYWGSPTKGADASNTYGDPFEIKCFWEGESFFTMTIDGKEVSLRARIHVLEDLDEQGMLFHGRLADLTTAERANPKKASRAYEIKRFIKTPSMGARNKYNRIAMIWYG